MTASQTTSASYEVGYRKPPRHTQFQKGQSGNPGGRPRRSRTRRLEDLALYEAYRPTIVMEDGHAVPVPAIQAVLRSQIESAAGGNVRAQRDILAMIQHIELIRDVCGSGSADDDVVDDDDADASDGDGNDVDDTDDADASDGDDNDIDDTDDADASDGDDNDTADADRDDAGGADGDEPAQKQADGIGERRHLVARVERSETREHAFNAVPPPPGFAGAQPGLQRSSPTAPHPVSTPQPEDAAAARDARKPSLPSGSGGGQRRRALPRRNGPGRSAGVQSAQQPRGRPAAGRRSTPAKSGRGHSGSSRRSPGRTNPGPGPAQAAGGHARAPTTPPKRGEKLKTRC